ncbi:EVE domain-containing protein [Flavilitoribacter nigricans]|uniref:UPF0310 protein CRP01_03855 n=1 Tax=Flavilitoribacter nigricans (strain ATCC 23147 / DSM 23189 / NBRC 102662 / NCIMB 1420 / SS-2) TaxID=1122177 RepID=A0A2D0NHE4_FLAN2|nr:EVE domain-containing protein [Flavilitoribacter nigricans]PHN07897.1 EVE domain-containing protein [Flavilitoribacter nigricans DSM 23189 = NBRC 102662]
MSQSKRGTKYWIIVASKDHVKTGKAEGIAQACHGKSSPLKRMHPGDFVIYYSGKQSLGEKKLCQEFTAIGRVDDEEVYQVELSPDFCPHRRNITFFPNRDVSIRPLIEDLEFIRNKSRWGYPFRYGILEINQHDFALIAEEMLEDQVNLAEGVPAQ